MRHSQGDGINTPCLGLCTVPTFIILQMSLVIIIGVPFLYVCGYLPWHGHVLPGTLIIKIMCVSHLYLQG